MAWTVGRSKRLPTLSAWEGIPILDSSLTMLSLSLLLLGSRIIISLGFTGSSAGISTQSPFEERTLDGFPCTRFLTLIAIIIACLSIESGFPKPNESTGEVRSSGGSEDPSVRIGHIHSIDPGDSDLSLHALRGCGSA